MTVHEVRLVRRGITAGAARIVNDGLVPDLTGLPSKFYPREEGWWAVMAWFGKGVTPPADRKEVSKDFVFQVVFIEGE